MTVVIKYYTYTRLIKIKTVAAIFKKCIKSYYMKHHKMRADIEIRRN